MAYPASTTYADPTNVMGRRIGAWFIDIFVPLLAAAIVGWIVFLGAATKVENVPTDYCTAVRLQTTNSACITLGNDAYVGTSADRDHAVSVALLVSLVGAANLFLLQGLTGAALGKHMLGLRVVRADGQIAGFGWNALRTLLLVVDQFFCALIGLITACVTHPHRRVGDFAAGTFVVGRNAVGRPIGTPEPAYAPQWAPPGGPTGWGPPPASAQPGWAPTTPAPAPGWGQPPASTPPVSTPPPSSAPPTWGSPAANPPASAAPAHWGTPQPEPVPQPVPEPEPAPAPQPDPAPLPEMTTPVVAEPVEPAPVADAPGWAAPEPVHTPAPQPEPEPTPAPATEPAPSAREPQWDPQRNAWVFWEAETNRWLQHDPATNSWGPLR